jgi:hypothetical protein
LVTVATLLISSRILVEAGSKQGYCVRGRDARTVQLRSAASPYAIGVSGLCQPSGQVLHAFRYRSVTHSIDDLVTLSTAFAAFWYVTIRQ